MNENKTQANLEIKQVLNEPYKYGFQTDIETESFPFGLNKDIVKLISEKKDEPSFMLDFRLKSYKKWQSMKMPEWANISVKPINYDSIT